MSHLKEWLDAKEQTPTAGLPNSPQSRVNDSLGDARQAFRSRNAASTQSLLEEKLPAGDLFRRFQMHASPPRRNAMPWWILVAGSAAALLVLQLSTRTPSPDVAPARNPSPTARLKSASKPALHAYRRTADHAERLDPMASVHSGDQIQFEVQAEGFEFAYLVGVDGAGTFTPYASSTDGLSTILTDPMREQLPFSITLDSTGGRERFFVVLSHERLSREQAIRSVSAEIEGRFNAGAESVVGIEFKKP